MLLWLYTPINYWLFIHWCYLSTSIAVHPLLAFLWPPPSNHGIYKSVVSFTVPEIFHLTISTSSHDTPCKLRSPPPSSPQSTEVDAPNLQAANPCIVTPNKHSCCQRVRHNSGQAWTPLYPRLESQSDGVQRTHLTCRQQQNISSNIHKCILSHGNHHSRTGICKLFNRPCLLSQVINAVLLPFSTMWKHL